MKIRQSKFVKIISLCLALIFSSQQIGWAEVVDLRQGADGWDYALAVLAGVISAQGVKSDWGVLQTFTYTYVIPEVCDWAIDKGTSLKGKEAMYASIALSSLLQSRFDYSNSASRAATSALQKTAEKATTFFTKIYNYVKNFFKPITNFFGKYSRAWTGAVIDSLTAVTITGAKDIAGRNLGDDSRAEFFALLGGTGLGFLVRLGLQKATKTLLGYDPKYGPTATKPEEGVRIWYKDVTTGELTSEIVDLETAAKMGVPTDYFMGSLPELPSTGEDGRVIIGVEKGDFVNVWDEARGEYVDKTFNQALKGQVGNFIRQLVPVISMAGTKWIAESCGAKKEEAILLSSFAGSTSAYGFRGDPKKTPEKLDDDYALKNDLRPFFKTDTDSEKNSYSWTGFFKSMGEGALKGLISVGLQQASLKTKSPLHGAVVNMAASNVLQFAAIRRPLKEQNEASQQQTEKIGEKTKNILGSIPIINMPFSWISGTATYLDSKSRKDSLDRQTLLGGTSEDYLRLTGGDGNFITSYFKGKDPALLYQLFSMSVTEANTDFYSFGRAAPYLNGNTAGFRWTSGNDVFFLSRYADYVKDVHNDGLLGGLMSQFVSSYHDQAVNNVYSVVTDGVNSLPFTKRLAPYQQRASSFNSLFRLQDRIIENLPELMKQNEEKQLAEVGCKDLQELEKKVKELGLLDKSEEELKEETPEGKMVKVYKDLTKINEEYAQLEKNKDALKAAETKDMKRFGWATAGASAATFWNPLAIMFINTPELEQDSMDSTLSERTNHIQAISRLLSPELIEERGEQKQQENKILAGVLPDGLSKQAFLSTNYGPVQLFSELDKEQSRYDYYNGKTKVIEEDKGWQRLSGVYKDYYKGDLPQVVKDKGLVYDEIPADVEKQVIMSTGEYKNNLSQITKTVEEEMKGKVTIEASRGREEYLNQRWEEEKPKMNKEIDTTIQSEAKKQGIDIADQRNYQYLRQRIEPEVRDRYAQEIKQEAEAKVNQEVSQVMIAPAMQRQISNEAEKRALSKTKVDLSGSDLMGAVKYHRDWAEVNPVYEGRWQQKSVPAAQPSPVQPMQPVVPTVPELPAKPPASADVTVRGVNYQRFNVGISSEYEKPVFSQKNKTELQAEIAKLKEINPDLSQLTIDVSSSGGLLVGGTDIYDGPAGKYDNVGLAMKRREDIKSFLVEQGIPEKNIRYVDTMGPYLKAPKEDYRGRQKDRTLDITFGYVSEGVVKESSLTPAQQQLLQQDSSGNKFFTQTTYNPVKTLPSEIKEVEYTVMPGDTIYDISFKYNKEYRKQGLTTSPVRIMDLNKIKSPKDLQAGQKIKVVME